MKNYIAPSLLSADKENLESEIKKVEVLGAEYIHWDIMDGIFVTNKSFEDSVVAKYSKCHKMVNDVHIMVVDPKHVAPMFIKAGADIVTFHYEAAENYKNSLAIIDLIHSQKCKAGISIKPKTSVWVLKRLVSKVDLVLIMSVEPGKGGQAFIPSALNKIKKLRRWIDRKNLNCLIEVDGGINGETGKLCREAGVDILVAGSYLYGHDDIKERFETLR